MRPPGLERALPQQASEEAREARRALIENVESVREVAEKRRAELRSSIEARRAEVEEKIQNRRAELRSRFTLRSQEQIEHITTQLERRYVTALERLSNIATRIQSRIDKAESEGVDVSEAEASLERANELIEEAERFIVEATVSADALLEVENAPSLWAEARSHYTEAKRLLQAIHEALRASLSALREQSATLNS
jgi:hypothetical protein